MRGTAADVRSGRRSPLEVLEASLDRVRAVDPVVRAFVSIDGDQVRAEAAALTEEAAHGRFRGPLHGVPIAVKDLIDVRGHPTRGGSLVTEDAPATRDAPAVHRLRAAGALVLGKTTTHEFAHGVTTPPTRNPWDPTRIPGGSSGGSAAAVASGQVPAALGSDTGGSIRVPAALCGVSGLRPRPADVPTGGCLPFSPKLDTCGPIAGDAEDLALLFAVLGQAPCPLIPSVAGLRLGTVPPAALGDVDAEVLAAVESAVGVLVAEGAVPVPVDVPPFPEWSAPRTVYVLSDFLAVHRGAGWYPARREHYGEEVASYLTLAERITRHEREAAVRELERLEGLLRAALEDVDALVLPTTAVAAPTIEECAFRPGDAGRSPVVGTLMRLCGPFSWCGFAVVSVPCGATADGRPIGVQVVGRDVPTVLGVAARYQARTDHHLRTPSPAPAPAGAGGP
ncbi:aspartyl-tRNA(Asn)/glutamyl-tRNA(Gln) amidotransferase subunit A [Geodermatophilus sabuli]|uniref:Aspartyl-tRNA(Asn)/glutamyl-tRNA(Gln) amidotransferase subunit A n=1 Tax=Geodermatophilus sabuli TaxID=1564158 RepID=A0A285EI22_9ACTN|nr:aspartyl-tRNA(Asn)/glutamyl-tRNA(Gln) amidotransferase subunit A [Geodermatophilus sabuli]